ncbi:MAG: M17 family peptidase N-terminal domain-containing protein, partial [Stellaceae bacterium]
MKIEFAESGVPQVGAVAVGVWEDGVLTPAAKRLDEATGGALSRALAVSPRFRGRKDDLLPVVAPPGLPLSRIVLAGLGKPASVDALLLQDLGGALYAHLAGAGEEEATLAIDLGEGAALGKAAAAAELAFGARL